MSLVFHSEFRGLYQIQETVAQYQDIHVWLLRAKESVIVLADIHVCARIYKEPRDIQ